MKSQAGNKGTCLGIFRVLQEINKSLHKAKYFEVCEALD